MKIGDGLQTVTQKVGRRPYNEATHSHKEDLLLTKVELRKPMEQQCIGTTKQIDPEAKGKEAMDAETEDVDEDDDKPE